jgi:hypothetical protein
MRKPTKKSMAIVLAAAIVLAGGGAAYAYWTAGGSGTGSAAAAAGTTPVTAVQTSTVASMKPGDTAQALTGNFTNTNGGPVYVTSVTAAVGTVTKAVGAPAGTCDGTDFTLASAVMTVGAEVANGTAQGAWTGATLKFNDKPAANQDACKGATVAITYTVI